jgi:hypothetical protein
VCDPALANLALAPRVLRAAAAVLGQPEERLRLAQTPCPCVTWRSEPGAERTEPGFHVDWPPTTAAAAAAGRLEETRAARTAISPRPALF